MTRIGHYEILSVLGDGGMGTVYKARDPRFDRIIALKVLDPKLHRVAGLPDRFRAEAVIQAKLQHPHIVTVHDFLDDGETLAIVQELVPGRPLDARLRERGAQSPAWAARIVDQVASALGYAHTQGLVHRDIKPSNVLIAEIDGQPVAKVTDFGIAKVLGSDKLRTATGAKMGTLAYMSPEHVESPKGVDHRSDIYALGAVLYEVLTGKPAFDADTEYALMDQILRAPVPRPSLAARGLPPGLDAVVARAMAKAPGDRYQTCEEMRQALAATSGTVPSPRPTADAGPPVFATPAETPSRPAGAKAAAWFAWAVGLLVVGAIVAALLVVQTDRAKQERHAQDVAVAERERHYQAEVERQRQEAEAARRKAEEAGRRQEALRRATRNLDGAQQAALGVVGALQRRDVAALARQLPAAGVEAFDESGSQRFSRDDILSAARGSRNAAYYVFFAEVAETQGRLGWSSIAAGSRGFGPIVDLDEDGSGASVRIAGGGGGICSIHFRMTEGGWVMDGPWQLLCLQNYGALPLDDTRLNRLFPTRPQ